jgi:hypothetical protein
MRSILWAAMPLIALAPLPAVAQGSVPGAALYTLADVEAIFVGNQQYFVFDTEGTSNAQLNHLHFNQINTTTGDFEGELAGPTLPEGFVVPATVVPVTGTITVTPGTDVNENTGYFYGITFSWSLTVPPCEGMGGSYTGAISFQGWEGSGKMHAVIAGIENANWGACGIGSAVFNPLPFSGQLTK